MPTIFRVKLVELLIPTEDQTCWKPLGDFILPAFWKKCSLVAQRSFSFSRLGIFGAGLILERWDLVGIKTVSEFLLTLQA